MFDSQSARMRPAPRSRARGPLAAPAGLRALALAASALAAAVFCACKGRGDTPGEEHGAAAEVARAARPGSKVILLGLDGADWSLLDDYLERGAMPNLGALVREGRGGVLWSLHPPLSPLVWTTMMTGVSPLEHEILDFARFHPQSGVKEPITSDERKVPAVWNMATYGGRSVAVLGMWATYPAEPVNGLLVSDRLFTFLYQEDEPPPGAVHPPEREAWAREALRHAEAEVGFEEVAAYLPWLERSEYEEHRRAANPYAHPVSALRRILIETRLYHDLAMDILRGEAPDLTVVYFQGTDTIGHVFAPFAPPRQEEIAPADFERYQRVPELYFRYVDHLLGEYRERARATGSVLMLVSDHGFKWHEGRPTHLSSFAGPTAAKWHLLSGVYLLWGAGIEAEAGHPGKGKVGQVCATLLDLLGLPPGRRLAGPPLAAPSEPERPAVDYRSHYRAVASVAADADVARRELEKLQALGYLGSGEAEQRAGGNGGSRSTWTASAFNNAGLILQADGRPQEAIAAFEQAMRVDPSLASALWNLSDILFDDERDLDRSDELLVKAFANGLPEGKQYLIGRAIGYQRDGRIERSERLLAGGVEARPDDAELLLFRGRYRIEAGDCSGALDDFRRASEIEPDNPAASASAGLAHLCLGDRAAAARAFRRSLALEPDQPRLREYLSGSSPSRP